MYYTVEISELQPSQLYINRNEIRKLIMEGFDSEVFEKNPLKVIKIGNKLVIVERHTEAFLAYQQGDEYIHIAVMDEIENLNYYRKTAAICKDEGITSLTDLGKQILSNEDFEREWASLSLKKD